MSPKYLIKINDHWHFRLSIKFIQYMYPIKSITRRNFVKKTALTAGLMALGSEAIIGKSFMAAASNIANGHTSGHSTIVAHGGLSADAHAIISQSSLEEEYRSRFNVLLQSGWQEIFADSGRDDWRKKWFLDGETARVENSPDGMTIHAGPVAQRETDHAVLWTKEVFEADNLKIEYNFTRIDNSIVNVGTVNIIYILAQGGNGKPADILEWADERRSPNMEKYYNFMHAYHVSYAVSQPPSSPPEQDRYIRGRRYSASGLNGTELTPEYMNVPLFEQGATYQMTFIKAGRELFLHVEGNGKDRVFYFDASGFGPITKGRIGLRQMYTRVSRYSDFRFSSF